VRFEMRLVWPLTLCLAVASFVACSRPARTGTASWNPKAAATYLDQREVTWMGWPGAARDHGTFCVSCHTVMPYVLSRPALRNALAEQGQSEGERKIVENVTKRVRLWSQVAPYYTDEGYGNGKPAESRGTEAVLNALVLASNDAQGGKLSDDTRMALNNMWTLQLTEGDGKGAWSWLQFGMEPWEANDSQYFGAALAALATGTAPEDYRSSSGIKTNVNSLRDYLNRNAGKQSMMNRVVLLWASAKVPGLLDPERQKTIISEIMNEQQSDGGWALSSHAWPEGWSLHSMVRKRLRSDWTRQNADSDGYATGLVTYVLQEVGVSRQDSRLKQGLSWLAQNQSTYDGSWPSLSLNQRRNSSSNVGHFMRDAATAYAVLALSESSRVSDHDSDAGNLSTHSSRTLSAPPVAAATRGD
jgi:squalene-hopene/tetraprenyl-beta-curcumene cyclase